jgi:hypothetical protein
VEQKKVMRNEFGDDVMVPISGEDLLFHVADNTCQGDPEDAARKILQDYRSGRMGPICLQVAPQTDADRGQVDLMRSAAARRRRDTAHNSPERMEDRARMLRLEEHQARAASAIQTAKERGLELPPAYEPEPKDDSTGTISSPQQVGKGLFDGW